MISRYRHKIHIKLFCGILAFLMLISYLPAIATEAATSKLYYTATKKTVNYTGTKVKFNYNGSNIDLGGNFGILTSKDVAMGPYYEIFVKAMGLTCKKDSAKKTITFQNGDTKLVLTINSNTAVLNGKSVTISEAPVYVKYGDTGITRVIVPTRFISESFGYEYRYDSDDKTVYIRNKMTLSYNNKQVSYMGTFGTVKYNGANVDVSNFPSIIINNTAMLQANKVFKKAMGITYSFDTKTGQIVFQKDDLTLTMRTNHSEAFLNGLQMDCGVAPIYATIKETGVKALLVPGRFVSEALGYQYDWDSFKKESVIQYTDQVGVAKVSLDHSQDNTTYYSFAVDSEKYMNLENTIDKAVSSLGGSTSKTISELVSVVPDFSDSACERYRISFANSYHTVTAKQESNKLILTLKNSTAVEKNIDCSGSALVQSIQQKCDTATSEVTITFDLKNEYPYYNLTEDKNTKQFTLDIYPNYLVGMEVGANKYGEYLRFEGLQPLNYTLSEDGRFPTIQINDTCNLLGNIVFPDELFDDFLDYAVLLEPDMNQIRFTYQPSNNIKITVIRDSKYLYLYSNYMADSETTTSGLIQAKLPAAVKFSDIKVTDEYWNKKIVLCLPGEYKDYYTKNAIKNPYSVADSITVTENSGKTYITIKTSRIQGFKLSKTSKGFSIKLGNPSEIYSKIVVLDAGHGGIDSGAVAGGYKEKDFNFTILAKYALAYFEKSDIKVYLSRVDDTKIDLYERADFASLVEADMFISLHMNAADSTAAKGTSVYYSTINTSTNSGGLSSEKLASAINAALVKALGTNNRGVPTANFVVIKETRVPAILIELGFITNADDRKILSDPKKQELAGKTIYNTVVQLFKDYPVGR